MMNRQYQIDLSAHHRIDCFLRLSVQLFTTQSLVREKSFMFTTCFKFYFIYKKKKNFKKFLFRQDI
jgi:hypothetical protein